MKQETDRVRRHTAGAVLHRIDNATATRLLEHASSPEEAPARQHALEREWDMDRVIETEAAAVGLIGLALGALVHPRLLIVPKIVAASLLVHALTGWYPLLPLFRRLGVRSAREIARERYALKVLRGDFTNLAGAVASGQPTDQPPDVVERRRKPRGIH
jgi:hypothetical protein